VRASIRRGRDIFPLSFANSINPNRAMHRECQVQYRFKVEAASPKRRLTVHLCLSGIDTLQTGPHGHGEIAGSDKMSAALQPPLLQKRDLEMPGAGCRKTITAHLCRLERTPFPSIHRCIYLPGVGSAADSRLSSEQHRHCAVVSFVVY